MGVVSLNFNKVCSQNLSKVICSWDFFFFVFVKEMLRHFASIRHIHNRCKIDNTTKLYPHLAMHIAKKKLLLLFPFYSLSPLMSDTLLLEFVYKFFCSLLLLVCVCKIVLFWYKEKKKKKRCMIYYKNGYIK